MCLIFTIIAAIIFSIVCFIQKNHNKSYNSTLTTTLAFLGAALMWCVDGISNLLSKEPFFDFSLQDTILGLIIVGVGLLLFIFLKLREIRHEKF